MSIPKPQCSQAEQFKSSRNGDLVDQESLDFEAKLLELLQDKGYYPAGLDSFPNVQVWPQSQSDFRNIDASLNHHWITCPSQCFKNNGCIVQAPVQKGCVQVVHRDCRKKSAEDNWVTTPGEIPAKCLWRDAGPCLQRQRLAWYRLRHSFPFCRRGPKFYWRSWPSFWTLPNKWTKQNSAVNY